MKFKEAILEGLNMNLSGAIELFVYAPLGFKHRKPRPVIYGSNLHYSCPVESQVAD
jgi:hypothetical protein